MELIKVKINSFYDGDTFRADVVGAGRFHEILTNAPFRLRGINCPERRSKSDREKELYLKSMSLISSLIDSGGSTRIDLDGKLSFGRFHTDLYVGDINLANYLIDNKVAVLYNGEYSVKDFDWDLFYNKNYN